MDIRARVQQANDDTYAAWNAHDADAVAAVFARDAEIIDVASGTITRGRDAIRVTAVERFIGFPNFSLEKQTLLSSSRRPCVGEGGLEPPASCSQSRRATKLRYTPCPPHHTRRSGRALADTHGE